MRWFRLVLVVSLIAVGLFAVPRSTRAQGGQFLQVWMVPDESGKLDRVEYRDAGQNVLASYTLTAGAAVGWTYQSGGRLYSMSQDTISIFDPFTGLVTFYAPPGKSPTSAEAFSQLLRPAPNPVNQTYAYAVVSIPTDMQSPATSSIYVATPGAADDHIVYQTQHEPYLAVEPIGWSADGGTLLLQDMPQGIGGYILFMSYNNVRALNLSTGVFTPLESIDGYSSDLQYTAVVDTNDSGPVSLTVIQVSTWQSQTAPLPALGEQPSVGGNAIFSPANSHVAYQVARGVPDSEKFWTIVVTGSESRVVLEDESGRYSDISGWLDENTLVVGSAFSLQSAIIDVNSGTVLREVPGNFLGYANGLTSTSGFAPSGTVYAQCPGAPVTRLTVFGRGRITTSNGSLTNVRSYPGTQAEISATMPEGSTFTVSTGPDCVEGYAWWYVQFDNGPYGAVAEGDLQSYYLEPWQ